MKSISFYFLMFCSILLHAQRIETPMDSVHESEKDLSPPQKEWSVDFSGFVQADVIIDNKKAFFVDGFFLYVNSDSTTLANGIRMPFGIIIK